MVRLRVVAVVAALVLVFGACSGDSEADSKELEDLKAQLSALRQQEKRVKDELASIEEDGVLETTTSTTVPSEVSADASAVGLEFYYEEFKVTVVSTEVKPDPNRADRATLEILFECENVGGNEGYCPYDARIESDGEFYTPSDTDNPLVPAGRKGDGAYRFIVDDKFSLVDAVLRIGSSPRHVVVVPLCPGPSSPETVLLAPVDIGVSGSMEAGQVTTTIKKVRLAVDHPNHRTRDAKKLTMYLTMDVNAKVTEEYEGYYLEHARYLLKLPNGNTAVAEDWSIDNAWVNADLTETDVVIRYEVNNPPAGTYTLEYTPMKRGELEPPPGAVSFSV